MLTKIMARAVLRSLRYFSRYFSFWFFLWPRFILVLGSEELVGEGKAWAELPDPELELRKDWAAKACRACWRSSLVWDRKPDIWSYDTSNTWGLRSCCPQEEDGWQKMQTIKEQQWCFSQRGWKWIRTILCSEIIPSYYCLINNSKIKQHYYCGFL